MLNINKQQQKMDKKRLLRESDHLTRPPRMEGRTQSRNMKQAKRGKAR